MICAACGYEILGKHHSTDNGSKFVCERCWNNPDLFFPEKLLQDSRLKLLSRMAREEKIAQKVTKVQVIRLFQKGIELYVGKMKARTILRLCEIDKFEEEELSGYQREIYKERTSELVEYLNECSVAVMPGLFISLRKGSFVPEEGDIGVLEIPNKRGSLWIIDGQHRIGGFERIKDMFVFESNTTIPSDHYSSLMDYELPIVFINSEEVVQQLSSLQKLSVKSEDLERAMFFIVNKTQKGINPSLKDALLYRIQVGGIEGIPSIKKENWRIHATFLGVTLNQEADSPLNNLINISGKREQGKPIQLNSFVSSLEKLFRDKHFSDLTDEDRLKFIRTYWTVLGKMLPEAFDRKTSREYMVLKALGLYSLHWLAQDILRYCVRNSLDHYNEKTLEGLLIPLKLFDWTTRSSLLSKLGGMKGVNEAHRLLLEALNDQNNFLGNTEFNQSQSRQLEDFLKSGESP